MTTTAWIAIGSWFLAWAVTFSELIVTIDTIEVHCTAAKETVIEETDLIAASGRMPSERMTDRWKNLLKGCRE